MIVDANIVVHWFSPSDFTDAVMQFHGRADLVAPAYLLVETANVLYKNARGGRISANACAAAVPILEKAMAELVPDRVLLSAAIDLALANSHPVYDCLYLALALERREPLATADRRMADLAVKLAIETHLIRPIPA